MKLLPLLAGALVAAATLTGSAVAMADEAPATGPDSVACANANADVLRTAIAANAAAGNVGDEQAVVLAGLKDAVETASADVNTANTTFQTAAAAAKADPTDTVKQQTAADKLALLVAAQGRLRTAATNLAAGPGLTPAQKAALDKANGDVAAAIEKRVKACAAQPVTTPSATPTPTPEPLFANCSEVRDAGKAPLGKDQPGYRLGLDTDGDGVACEFDDVPVPARIDTGRA